jgi:light-regulated signal transduction histidine kinase (bacteriophytochrome)
MSADGEMDLNACDREPIHVPGSIQPHGLMLVADPETLRVVQGAGRLSETFGEGWLGSDCAALLGEAAGEALRAGPASVARVTTPDGATWDLTAHKAGARLVVELEPEEDDAARFGLLQTLERGAAGFEAAQDLGALCRRAAREFRALTGYDHVMVYRFLEEGAGQVLGEDMAEGRRSFLNHHFPATDIPKQARALYVRNLVRVIPDAGYRPAPLEPALEDGPLDMSDSVLRSVSPIHLQYLQNMGVAASASVSIIKDGGLWGLIACHNATPRLIGTERRIACRALAAGLARQIKSREDTDAYRERVRLRTHEDSIVELLLREGSLDEALSRHASEIRRMLDGDGVAVLRGGEVVTDGVTPSADQIKRLAKWIPGQGRRPVFHTRRLGERFELPADQAAVSAGVLAITLLGEINHRVQNSLQLVSSFLGLQARETEDGPATLAIEEARRRIAAVSLVYRRLYRSDQVESVDAARYIDELLDELIGSFGEDWRRHITRDLDPVLLPNDRAISLGLILTELVINTNKYAYGGEAGPLRVSLGENGATMRLTVTDSGVGRDGAVKGFGSRFVDALVKQLGGELDYSDNAPGSRAVFTAPVQ